MTSVIEGGRCPDPESDAIARVWNVSYETDGGAISETVTAMCGAGLCTGACALIGPGRDGGVAGRDVGQRPRDRSTAVVKTWSSAAPSTRAPENDTNAA